MPAPVHVIRIIPVDLLDDVQTVTGLTATTALYTKADPLPRAVTHRSGSGPVNSTQRAMLDAAKDVNGDIVATEIDPSFVGVLFKDWPRDLASPYNGMLEEAGLTTDANFEA
jgi:hypothetical protein